MLLEGYQPEEITEAVHANHPYLDKRPRKPGDTYNESGNWLHNVKQSRNELAKSIVNYRQKRQLGDSNAAFNDNMARLLSVTGGDMAGGKTGAENINKQKFGSIPRIISSAKQ